MTNISGETGGIDAVIARIAERSANLSRLDDEYLRLIARAEEAMRGLGIGLRLGVVIDTTDGGPHSLDYHRLLVFDKNANGWRFSIESGADGDDPEDWNSTPLASCERDLRFSVFAEGHLEKLLVRAVEEIDKAVADREKHLERSATLVKAIEHGRALRKGKS